MRVNSNFPCMHRFDFSCFLLGSLTNGLDLFLSLCLTLRFGFWPLEICRMWDSNSYWRTRVWSPFGRNSIQMTLDCSESLENTFNMQSMTWEWDLPWFDPSELLLWAMSENSENSLGSMFEHHTWSWFSVLGSSLSCKWLLNLFLLFIQLGNTLLTPCLVLIF